MWLWAFGRNKNRIRDEIQEAERARMAAQIQAQRTRGRAHVVRRTAAELAAHREMVDILVPEHRRT